MAETRRREDGFTLVEILVVLAILGVLSVVAVFAVRGLNSRGEESACSAERATLTRSQEAYQAQHGEYGTESDLVDAELMRKESPMYDFTLANDNYQLVAVGTCAAGSSGGAATTTTTAPPNVLVFAGTPTTVTAGVIITPAITVTVQAPNGTPLTTSGLPVTISLASSPGATLSGTLTVNTVNGVATFADLSVNRSGNHTFVASMAGATTRTGPTFAVVAGTPTQLSVVQQPSNGITTTAFGQQPQIEVLDQFGNRASAPKNISLGVTVGTGTAGAALACTTNPVASVAGIGSFSGCKITTAGIGYTITASSPGLTSAVTSAVTVTGPPTKVVITQQPTNVIANAVIAPAITVAVQDAASRVVTVSTATITMTISTNPGTAALSGTVSMPVVNGVATFSSLGLTKPGTAYKLTAASTGLTSAVSNAFNVTIGPPAKLAVTTQPAGIKAGVAWTTQPKVTVQDAYGNTVTTSTASVTLAITSGSGVTGATLTCTTNPLAAVAGIASFAGCKIGPPGSDYSLTATSGALTSGVSGVFDNPVGPPTKVVITQQPSALVAGEVIAPAVIVTVQDAVGNTVNTSSATVTMTVSTNPGSSTLAGTTSVTAVDGIATFSNLSLNRPGTAYKLTAASTGLTSAVSSAFNVTIGAPAKLAFTTQPAGIKAGVVWTTQPRVTVQDVAGNTITTSTASIQLAITSGTGTDGATLACTANPKAAVTGVAIFAGCKIPAPGTGYTLTATSAGLDDAVSAVFDNPIGPATKLIITQQPSNIVAGTQIGPSVTVTVQDVAGNVVTTSSATVTVNISTNPGSSTLSGTTSISVVNGMATFSSLSLNKVGTGYKLTAAATGLTSAVSGTFNVTPAAADKLAFTTQPGGGARNVVWGTQPKVTVQDGFGNTITTSTASVTITITTGTGTGGAALTCTAATKAATAGVVTYAGCKINTAGTGYTLTATSGTLTATLSNAITIT